METSEKLENGSETRARDFTSLLQPYFDVKNLTDAQARIRELEEALWEAVTDQKKMQDEITDIQVRSRKNNIKISGVPEGTEGDSVHRFSEDFFQAELPLPAGANLCIQQAYREGAGTPRRGVMPRPIIVEFQRYDVKEMILKMALQKRIEINGKAIIFDRDYPTGLGNKRKACNEIKKTLKAEGVRFQTPFIGMKIYWNDGARRYYSAQEAVIELKKRGMEIKMKETEVETTAEDQARATCFDLLRVFGFW